MFEDTGTAPRGWVDIDMELSDKQVGSLLLAGIFTLEPGGILQVTPDGSRFITQYCNEQAKLKTGLTLDQMKAIIDA